MDLVSNAEWGKARITSFVVLNWNGGDAVMECIQSILNQREEVVECVVVDNASSDGSLAKIRTSFPSLQIVENATNIGFAAGMNRGLRVCTGDIVVPTNQDVELAPDFARETRRAMEADSAIAAVGGVLLRLVDGRRTNEFDAGGYFLSARIAARLFGSAVGPIDVFGVSGACPAFRASALSEAELRPLEYYDEDYFAYFEDIDLFFRLQLLGRRVVYTDRVRAWHHRSMSTGGGRRFFQRPAWIQRHQFRNRYLTLIKNCPKQNLPHILPGFFLAELLTWPYLLFRSPRSLSILVRTWFDVYHMLPATLKKRRLIQLRLKVGPAHLRKFLRGL